MPDGLAAECYADFLIPLAFRFLMHPLLTLLFYLIDRFARFFDFFVIFTVYLDTY